MKSLIIKSSALVIILLFAAMSTGVAVITYEPGANYNKYIKYDRYLDVEIWVDDDAYYEGDEINISFRANKDCYVAIYNIDSRGRVNLIFPNAPGDDSRIESNSIYRLPDRHDSFELTIQGPEGVEYLQIVASGQPFSIPDWYGGSGIVCNDDPYDFLEYINANYFGGERDQARAFDLTSFVVREWERYYFRPHYNHYYDPWDWGYCGSIYIDYPFGSTIYIDGVYWGIAPLFIPRLYFGWHYVTIYDHYGWCWEDRISIDRYRSIVIDESIVRTKVGVKSRFKEARAGGYLNPVTSGYPDYEAKVKVKKAYKPVSRIEGDGRVKYAAEKSTRTVRENSYKSKTKTATKNSDAYERTSRKSNETSTREKSTGVEKRRSTTKSRNDTSNKTYRTTKTDRSSSATKTRSYEKTTSKNKSTTTRQSKSSSGKSRVTNKSGGSGTSSKATTKTRSSGSSSDVKKRGK